jgi:hypothetical protein
LKYFSRFDHLRVKPGGFPNNTTTLTKILIKTRARMQPAHRYNTLEKRI